MTRVRVATFNVENMRLHRTRSGKPHLMGARDGDAPHETGPDAARLDVDDRRLTARVIRDANADVVALQEVFDRPTLDFFHDRVLAKDEAGVYPHRVLEEGNDGRGLDVAVLSRRPFARVVSHAAAAFADFGLTPPDPDWTADDRVFRRDCLEIDVAVGEGILTLFVCHFKAMGADRAATRPVREAEARAVRALVERRFPDPGRAHWMILGDLNDEVERDGVPQADCALGALYEGGFAEDLLARIADPQDRWTYHYKPRDVYTRPDHMLASPALARANPDAVPVIQREGMWRAAVRHDGARYAEVGDLRPRASDHALVHVDLQL